MAPGRSIVALALLPGAMRAIAMEINRSNQRQSESQKSLVVELHVSDHTSTFFAQRGEISEIQHNYVATTSKCSNSAWFLWAAATIAAVGPVSLSLLSRERFLRLCADFDSRQHAILHGTKKAG